MKFTYVYLSLLIVGLIIRDAAFIVWEGQQVLVTQFGEIVRTPIVEAGLHFKLPLIQHAEFQDRRLLVWEGGAEQIPTGDQRYISVKSIGLWRIENLAEFVQTVQTVPVARARLDSIITGAFKDIISAHDLVEAVRMNNDLFRHPLVADDVKRELNARSIIEDKRELYTVQSRIELGRTALERKALIQASAEAHKLGIELITVNIKQLRYQDSIEAVITERMISERMRVAEKIRAMGRGEEARIRGKIANDLQMITAPAHREAEEIKGSADAEAIRLYAAALEADPKFYSFMRTMDAYRRGLTQQKGELILSSKSTFFDGFKPSFSE